MRYTFLSVHSVQGIVHPSGEPDLQLFHDVPMGLRVFLTDNVNAHIRLINRQGALLSMLLQAKIGKPPAPDFAERLAEEIASIERQRLGAIGKEPALIIEMTGDIDAAIPSNALFIDDFILCFDAFDRKALRNRHQSKISAVLTAIRIGKGGNYVFRPILDGSYLTTDEGQVVHSASIEFGAPRMQVSSGLTKYERARLAVDIPLVLEATGLERVLHLYAQSLNVTKDNYRSFIASWSALEILIGKLFPTYQNLLAAELHGVSETPGLHAYLDRMAAVMGDKHNLADKFSVLTVYLDHEEGGDELGRFRSLKKIRDRVFHGEDIAEATLPTQEVQHLFDKYLRNHLQHSSTTS